MIAVMGATGRTGREVVNRLLDAGSPVRVLGRSADALAPFTRRGAEAAVLDVEEAGALARAFDDADAVYAMIPPNYAAGDTFGRYDRIAAAIEAGIRSARVRKVAFLSSLGGDLPSGTGPIVGLHRAEERLKRVPGIDLLILRPAYFMENLLANVPLVKGQGLNGGAIEPDAKLPMIAARDIGVSAAEALRLSEFSGTTVRELLGQRDVTMREATRVLGRAIGKPDLAYVRFPDEAFAQALTASGIAPEVGALLVEMSHAISAGKVATREGRNAGNTTPTSIEDFSAEFAAAYARA